MGKRGPKQLPRRERFFARVDKSGECWLWTGRVNEQRGGYGYFYDDDTRLRRAHRVAWELETGESLSPDIVLCHRCDEPRCVRVSHLWQGSQSENMADMRAKGRANDFPTRERGTDRYNAKLDPDKVRTLRIAHLAGQNITALAKTYGITQACAHSAISRKTWAHVE